MTYPRKKRAKPSILSIEYKIMNKFSETDANSTQIKRKVKKFAFYSIFSILRSLAQVMEW